MQEGTQYTVDYFIEKFEAIPEELWITNEFEKDGKCCVLGHCGERMDVDTQEADFLSEILYGMAAVINNVAFDKYQQNTPKQRILAALNDVKNGNF